MKAWIEAAKALVDGGVEAVRRLAVASEEQRAMLARGAEAFAGAIAQGDVVTGAELARRRAICRSCPSYTIETAPGAEAPSGWCGPALTDRMDQATPTCGCLVVTKAVVGSERCPQGRWEEATARSD